jgi:hypothetical protein
MKKLEGSIGQHLAEQVARPPHPPRHAADIVASGSAKLDATEDSKIISENARVEFCTAFPHCSAGPASVCRETCSLTPAPDVPIATGRAGLSPGRALVPYAGAGTPAADDACAAGRTMATRPASVCGVSVSGANAGNDGEKKRFSCRSPSFGR